jgi:exodeoxyribonuclease-5
VEANFDPGAALLDPLQADLTFEEILDHWLRERLSEDGDTLLSELVYSNPARALEMVTRAAGAMRGSRGLAPPKAPNIPPLVRAFRKATSEFENFISKSEALEEETAAIADCFGEMADDVAFAAEESEPAVIVRLLTAAPHPDLCTKGGTFSQYRKKGKWDAAARAAGLSKADGASLNSAAELHHAACCSSWSALLQAAAGRVLSDLMTALQPINATFREYKRAAARLDFDDLIYAARDLLRDHPQVRSALAQRFRHVLVDEFQDTDPLQTEIFWRLCGDPGPDGANENWESFIIRPGALFLVGDPKQAIYRFRGADVSAYLRAREAIRDRNPHDLLSISTNFRSCASILSFVNERFETHLSSDGQPGFTALDAFHPDHDEGLCVAALDVACANEAGKASSEQQRDCEAEAVAEMCSRLIGSQTIVDRKAGVTRPCRPGDIALLAPTGAELWRYEEALERRGIPVATQAGKGFYRRQEVQDLIAIVRVLADSRDNLALAALLRGPLVGLTEEQLLDIVWALPRDPNRPGKVPPLTLRLDPEHVIDPLARDIIEKLQLLRRRINSTTPHELISQAVDVLRVRPILLERHAGQAERPLANIDLFLSLTQPYSVRGLKAFADAMTAAWEGKSRSAEGRPDAQEEAVSLYTIHASKGLEWPIVVPINTMTKIMAPSDVIIERRTNLLFMTVFGVAPNGYADVRDDEVAELNRERQRLWYVAATRARELLVLPRLNVAAGNGSWSSLIDLELDELTAIDLSSHSDGFGVTDGDPENEQTREQFAGEAARIVAASSKLTWMAPSRDEGLGAPIDVQPELKIKGFADDPGDDSVGSSLVQGGRDRGLILHKLLEEVLSRECLESEEELRRRAEHLIRQVGAEPALTPAAGLCPAELAGTVVRALELPEVAAIRDALIAEVPVYGIEEGKDGECAIFGIADAFAVSADGKPQLVIDWKSDVRPNLQATEHYRNQVRRYLEVTGIPRGLVVFVTTGEVVQVEQLHTSC